MTTAENPRHIAVLGGAGRIGRALCPRLSRSGSTVQVIDAHIGDESEAHNGFTQHALDLAQDAIDPLLIGPADTIIYLAAISSPRLAKALTLFQVNVGIAFNALQLSTTVGLDCQIYLSSEAVYGYAYPPQSVNLQPSFPVRETSAVKAIDAYGSSKLVGEWLANRCHKEGTRRLYVIRPSVVLFPETREAQLNRMMNDRSYASTKLFSACDCENLIEFIAYLIWNGPDGRHVFNFCRTVNILGVDSEHLIATYYEAATIEQEYFSKNCRASLITSNYPAANQFADDALFVKRA